MSYISRNNFTALFSKIRQLENTALPDKEKAVILSLKNKIHQSIKLIPNILILSRDEMPNAIELKQKYGWTGVFSAEPFADEESEKKGEFSEEYKAICNMGVEHGLEVVPVDHELQMEQTRNAVGGTMSRPGSTWGRPKFY